MNSFYLEVTLGVLFSVFAVALAGLLAFRARPVAGAIFAGIGARLLLAWLVYLKILAPPGTQADVIMFEDRARTWSLMTWPNLLSSLDLSSSYVVSWIGAVLYKVVGASPIMLNTISCMLGTCLIAASYHFAKELYNSRHGVITAWIVAIFPYAILYSSVYGRENWAALAFTLGVWSATRWARTTDPTQFVATVIAFAIATVFHGAFAIAILAFAIFAGWRGISAIHSLVRGDRSKIVAVLSGLAAFVIIAGGISLALASGITINKIGDLSSFSAAEALEARVVSRVADGGSAYPSALVGASAHSNPFALAGRLLYFVLSPFPWDIREPIHAAGFAATAVFGYIIFRLFKARREILSRQDTLAALFILGLMLAAFGVSIDNIGTSIRHRTKFVYVGLVLCLPTRRRVFGWDSPGMRAPPVRFKNPPKAARPTM